MALALASAGRLEESRNALVEVIDLLPVEPASPRLALVAACAAIEGVLGRHGDARRRLLAALDDAPAEARAGLALEMAEAAFWRGDAADMRHRATRAEDAAKGDSVLCASAAGLGGFGALWEGDADAASSSLDRATAFLAGADDHALAARLHCARDVAVLELHAERFARAVDTAARGVAIARRTRQGHALVPLVIVRAMAFVHLLDLEAAVREGESAEEGARLQGVPHLLQYALWARPGAPPARRDARGAAGRCRVQRCPATAGAERPDPHGSCTVAALGVDEDPERCIDEMQRAAGSRIEDVNPSWSTWLLLVLTRAGVALGRVDDAEAWATRGPARPRPWGFPQGPSAVAARGARCCSRERRRTRLRRSHRTPSRRGCKQLPRATPSTPV